MQGLLHGAVVGAIILAHTGASPQKEPYDAGSYLRAQRLVDVGGRHMNIYCSGVGSPIVILDAGLGGDTSDWRLVQSRIASHARVCSYDRAGMGFSDPPGWDVAHIARVWVVLTKRLGYTKFVAQGGDWGAVITEQMGVRAPPKLLGIHANMLGIFPVDIDKAAASGAPAPSGL